jgi:transposase
MGQTRMSGEAWITKMKDGRTHLAYKAEHAVDLETGAVVAVTIQPGDCGDTTSMRTTMAEAGLVVTERAGGCAQADGWDQLRRSVTWA